jgi:hypothetical protein
MWRREYWHGVCVQHTSFIHSVYVHFSLLVHGLYLIYQMEKRPKKKKLEKRGCCHGYVYTLPCSQPSFTYTRDLLKTSTHKSLPHLSAEHFPSYISCLSLPRLPLLPYFLLSPPADVMCCVRYYYLLSLFTSSSSKSPMTFYTHRQTPSLCTVYILSGPYYL